MKTNIVNLGKDCYGKKIGEALYPVGGDPYNGWDLEVTGIYETLDGKTVAYDGFMVFPVSSTNWNPEYQRKPMCRGKLRRKTRRSLRISEMCGVYYNRETGLAKYGKSRRLARRMAPNQAQKAELEGSLPF